MYSVVEIAANKPIAHGEEFLHPIPEGDSRLASPIPVDQRNKEIPFAGGSFCPGKTSIAFTSLIQQRLAMRKGNRRTNFPVLYYIEDKMTTIALFVFLY